MTSKTINISHAIMINVSPLDEYDKPFEFKPIDS